MPGVTFAVKARTLSVEQASSPHMVTVGLGSTVRITVSVAVPQLGVAPLVVVSLSVAEPVPVNTTCEVRLFGVVIPTLPQSPLSQVHRIVPLVALPAKAKLVVTPAEQSVWSGPAFAVGFWFSVRVAVSDAGLHPVPVPVLFTDMVSVTVPKLDTVTFG